MSLPKYDGSPLEWRRFLELFTTVIEKDSTLRDSEKTCLLLESMDTPETKELVKAASVGCNSYNTAIKALQKSTEDHELLQMNTSSSLPKGPRLDTIGKT